MFFGGNKEEEDTDRFGKSSYAERKAEIEHLKETQITVDKMKDMTSQAAKGLLRDIKQSASNIKSAITPDVARRILSRFNFAKDVGNAEERIEATYQRIDETIDDEYETHKRDKALAAKRANKLKRAKAGEALQADVIEAAAISEKKKDFAEYHARRDKQIEEREERIQREVRKKEEKIELEDHSRRLWRKNFWNEQSNILSKENIQLKSEMYSKLEHEYDTSLDGISDEWAARDLARARVQAEGPNLSSPIELPTRNLGVFGVPLGPGEFAAPDGGHVDGLDQSDIHVFDSAPQADYELSQINIYDVKSDMLREQDLQNALQMESKRVAISKDLMKNMLIQTERDLHQVESEIKAIEMAQTGPPKRLPIPSEVEAMHLNKERFNVLKKKIDDIHHSSDILESQRRKIESQMLSVSQNIAVAREKVNKMNDADKALNHGLGHLPVMIGRSLDKIPGGAGIMALPKEYQDAVVAKSKLVSMENQSKSALRAHKNRVEIDQRLWLLRQNKNEEVIDVERSITRMKEIGDRLKENNTKHTRISLVEAITAFSASPITLNKIKVTYNGSLNWADNILRDQYNNVARFGTHAKLGAKIFDDMKPLTDEEKMGITWKDAYKCSVEGKIKLPKNVLWNITLQVMCSNQKYKEEGYDETDHVVVRLGTGIHNMQVIGMYYKTINPDTGSILWDVNHIIKGNTLFFRFDFSSSSESIEDHLCIAPGLYEEYQLAGLEVIPDPGGMSGRTRVLSSYVKTIRVDERQGKLRLTKLLEELIDAEESNTITWDSDVMQYYPQRYNERTFFLRILRAEVLLEQSLNRKRKVITESSSNEGPKRSIEYMKKLVASKNAFMVRKRETQQSLVEEGIKLIGKRIDVWNNQTSDWRRMIVKLCDVRWIDNGLTAKVVHTLDEYDELNELIKADLKIDLTTVRWFESARQELDPEALKRFKQMKEWLRRLEEIDIQADEAQVSYRTAFEHAKKKEERKFLKEKRNIENQVKVSELDIPSELDRNSVKQEIAREVNVVLLDIRKGIIRLESQSEDDDTAKLSLHSLEVKERALEIATERYIEKRKKEMKEDADHYLSMKMEKMHNKIQLILQEHRDGEARTLEKLGKEKRALELYIRTQKQTEKDILLKRVKFDRETFNKAVPTAEICEHIKCKAWGDGHGKGVRCMSCGKEVTELWREPSQMAGYGSGCTPWLADAITRHRKDEAGFKFEFAWQLRKVEVERIRLEKERRDLQESEEYFYDLADLRVVYEFDQRHQGDIKASGAFRQGLQWKEEELQEYQDRRMAEEKQRIHDEGLHEIALEGFDPLSEVEEPAPTFRFQEERQYGQYLETMFGIGRLHNFQKKIVELKDARSEMLIDRSIYSDVLLSLHREQFKFDSELEGIEGDLDRTAKLLSTYDVMTRLWKKAGIILKQAEKEKKRAEMRHCGVWDDVREAQEKTNHLKSETRALLRLKFMYEQKLERLLKGKTDRSKLLQKYYNRLQTSALQTEKLQYCKPGLSVFTKYGWGRVRFYREEDDMLILTIKAGTRPMKVYMSAGEVVEADRSKQHGERLLMEQEDIATKKFISVEQAIIKKELFAMRKEEEGYKEYWELIDFSKFEESEMQRCVKEMVLSKFQLTKTHKFQKIMNQSVNADVEAAVEVRDKEIEAYMLEAKKGKLPVSGAPKKIDQVKLRRQLQKEMKELFLKEGAHLSHVTTKTRLRNERQMEIMKSVINDIILSNIDSWVKEVAVASIRDGMLAKRSAERVAGLIIPKPSFMQHSSYCLLRDLWKERKMFLKQELEMKIGAFKSKTRIETESNDELSATEQKAIKEAKAREEERQDKLCRELDEEEKIARQFYHAEMLINLRERREMQAAEAEMKAYLHELKLIEESIDENYATSQAVREAEMEKAKITDADRRREELKELVIERRRQKEEQDRMIEEDEFGIELRKFDRIERARIAREMNQGADMIEDDDEIKPDEIPPWMILPPDWDTMNNLEKKTFIEKGKAYKKACDKILRNNELDRQLWARQEKQGLKAWDELNLMSSVRSMGAELCWMVYEEEQRREDEIHEQLNGNIRKLGLFCREKGEDELASRTDLRKKRELATKREKELKVATDWYNLCYRRSRNREKLKRRVTEECKWSDTDAITGTYQRFKTERLRERLYFVYFNKIVDQILNRAEVIATERRLFRLHEFLSSNRSRLLERTEAMKKAWRDMQRDELCRLKRSALNNQGFFPLERRATLHKRFSSWLRFFLWNRGIREAYQMKYSLIKRKMEIHRRYNKQLKNGSNEGDSGEPESSGIISTMQKHRERPVQCKNCITFYVESQNHSYSCMYHPGSYKMLCPRSCKNPGLTPVCIAHRKARWSCCESTRSSAQGCARRYHVPQDSDPIYDKMMAQLDIRDADLLDGLDAKVDRARRENWKEQEMKTKRGQVWSVEDKLKRDREQIKYYENLKFV